MAFVTILGHRGAPREAPENTIASYRAAIAAGADGVELDVRLAPDGRLLLSHDPLPDPVRPGVATLAEALAGFEGVVNVEIKNLPTEPGWDPEERVALAVAEAVRSHGDRVIVSAFTLTTIDAMREVAPELRTGWLTPGGYDQAAAVETIVDRSHRLIHPHDSAITRELVDLAHAAGLQVVAWTVNAPDRMRELAEWGADVIITDDPALAVATLRSRP